MMKVTLLLLSLVSSSDAFSVGGGSQSFATRRSSSLYMNVENMPAKDIVKVGVIGMFLLVSKDVDFIGRVGSILVCGSMGKTSDQ